MKCHYLKEDKRPQKIPVRFSNEVAERISYIDWKNYNNIESIVQLHNYIVGLISWLSNPVIAWDYLNKYQHSKNGTTRIVEHGYDVSFRLNSDDNNILYILILGININVDEFGLIQENIQLKQISESQLRRIIRESIKKVLNII